MTEAGPKRHPPAMVAEVIEALRCRTLAGRPVFIDGTLGTAGHTMAMLEANRECRVVAFDRDLETMEQARQRLREAGWLHRVTMVHGDFRNAPELLQPNLDNQEVGVDGEPLLQIDGALVDAGMSLYQVSQGERGFSFRGDAPLDMRYDRSQPVSAFDLVNRLSPQELEDVLFKFTDERWARRIVAIITAHRHRNTINTTGELAGLVEAAIPAAVRRQSRVHPATKTFAALRMVVNDELWALEQGAWAISSILAPSARLVILTYSSNEDRTVKRTFRSLAGRPLADNAAAAGFARRRSPARLSPSGSGSGKAFPPLTFSDSQLHLQLPPEGGDPEARSLAAAAGFDTMWRMRIVTSRPLQPSADEITANPLARSCKLRAAEKVLFTPDTPSGS